MSPTLLFLAGWAAAAPPGPSDPTTQPVPAPEVPRGNGPEQAQPPRSAKATTPPSRPPASKPSDPSPAPSSSPEPPSAAEAPLRVAVAPVGGGGTPATRALVDALRALPRLTVVDLGAALDALGPEAAAAFQACADDPCRLEAAAPLAWDRLLVAALDGDRGTFRARLVEPGGAVPVRVVLEVGESGLEPVLSATILELFPVRAARSPSEVVIRGLPPRAQVRIDDRAPMDAVAGTLALRLPPGPHRVEARAPGHAPWTRDFAVRVGGPLDLEAELDKRRSSGPWWLAAGGLALAAGGTAFAVSAQIRSDDWAAACSGRTACAPGFTRARYLDDREAQDRERVAAVGLFVGAGLAFSGALVWAILDPGEGGPDDRFGAVRLAPGGLGVRF